MGKSSILNALVGEDRTVVSPISGTTRDAIDMEFTGSDGQVGQLLQNLIYARHLRTRISTKTRATVRTRFESVFIV